MTSLLHGPVDYGHIEAWVGQCLQYKTELNYNSRGYCTPECLQVNLQYSDQGNGKYAIDPGYGKNVRC